jgi:DNA-binding transcriptional MerR regulator
MLAAIHEWQQGHGKPGGRADAARRLDEAESLVREALRILEAEGLIQPERTPSGYRKFYDSDVDRLRSILRLQRDEYLPLKVIKDRLAQEEAEAQSAAADAEEETAAPAAGARPTKTRKVPAPAAPEEDDEELSEPPTGLQMTIDEMSAATGVEKDEILQLESFGLICSHGPEADKYYDGDDYVVLSIVKDFLKYGIEARHLRMYQHFAEREASFFESIIMPVLRQRNPDARRQATNSLTELARQSRKLKQTLLRINLREYLTSA